SPDSTVRCTLTSSSTSFRGIESAAEISCGDSPRRNICSARLLLLRFNPDRGAAGGTSTFEICANSLQRSSRLSSFVLHSVSSASSFLRQRPSQARRSHFNERNSARHRTIPRAITAYGAAGWRMFQSRRLSSCLLERAQALLAADHLLDPDAVIALHNHHFSAGDDAVIDNDLHRIVDRAIQLNNGAGVELEHVSQRKLGASERNADRKFDLHEKAEGLGLLHRPPFGPVRV